MIRIEKIGNEISPDIKIFDGESSFTIARNGLPDPCWYPNIDYYKNNDDITFTIKEEDGDIYLLFNKLYQDVLDGNVFPLVEDDIKRKSIGEIQKIKLSKAEERAEFKRMAKITGLVDNGVIRWHSEDYDEYDIASVLTIERVNKQIEITFSKNKVTELSLVGPMPTYNVRITEVGGRYGFFHTIFVRFRRELQSLKLDEPSKTLLKR